MKRNKENKELIQRAKTISKNGFHNIEAINSDDIYFLTQNIKSTDNKLVEKYIGLLVKLEYIDLKL